MRKLSTTSYQSLGIGALLGAAVAFIASAVIISRKDQLSEYLRQSGEGAGDTEDSIQRHDAKMFKDEVSSAQA